MLKLSISGCVLLAVCLIAHSTDTEWNEFKQKFNKVYNEAENRWRREIYDLNVKFIDEHNAEADRGSHSYRLGVNHFADLTMTERHAIGLKAPKPDARKYCTGKPDLKHGALPNSFDWRSLGFITAVKSQGQCGSPWAFSVTGAIEAREAIYCSPHRLVSLSEQNLMDCSEKYGNNGCYGGLMDQTYGYIQDNGGIDTEASYPYEAKDGKCRFNPNTIGAKIRGCVDLPAGNETAMQIVVFTNGPVSTGINAGQPSFQFYKSGVYDDPKCSPDQIDHAVLVVGYGTLNGKKYWICKNSWGTSWGDKGYILVARDHGNECGIANLASYPEMLCDF